MSKKHEVVAEIETLLVNAGLQYTISYIPSTESYCIYISDEKPEVEPQCSTCKHWGEEITDGINRCHKCWSGDKWEPRDE